MNNKQKVGNIVDIRTSLSQFIHKHTLNKGSMTSISCRAGLSTVRLITPLWKVSVALNLIRENADSSSPE